MCNVNAKLEHCDQSLGTLAVVEDQTAPWDYRSTREYKLTFTVPLIRLLVQQSNCFVVVERGRAIARCKRKRALNQAVYRGRETTLGKDRSLPPTIHLIQ